MRMATQGMGNRESVSEDRCGDSHTAVMIGRLVATVKSSSWLSHLIRRNPVFYRRQRAVLQHLQRADAATVRQWQEKRLKRVLAWARSTDYGRSLPVTQGLEKWPFLDKDRLRECPGDFVVPGHIPRIPASTGGSTGVPVALYRSVPSIVLEQVAIDFCCDLAGVDLVHGRVAVLRGDTIKPPDDHSPPFSRRPSERRLLMSAHHIYEGSAAYYVDDLRQFRPDCLLAYPSALEALLKQFDRLGEVVPVPLTMTSSEMLSARTRALVQRWFGGRVLDHYGQAERVALAYSMEEGRYFFLAGYGCVELEFVRSEEHYDVYEIIGTSLWNDVMPLIRYRTGDFAQVPKQADENDLAAICLGKKPFYGIEGRQSDYIVSPEGRRLIAMNHLPREVNHIARMQIVQDRVDAVVIRVVPLRSFDDADRQQIYDNARSKIPESMQVDVVTVSELEKTAAGKTPFIIRRVPEPGE